MEFTKEETETLTRRFVNQEREGTRPEEDGPAVILNGANREFLEILEKLKAVYNGFPTIWLKEDFIKALEGVVEFGEKVKRMATATAEDLDRQKAMNATAEDRLKEILSSGTEKQKFVFELDQDQRERIIWGLEALARGYEKDARDQKAELDKCRTPATEYHYNKTIATAQNCKEETLKLKEILLNVPPVQGRAQTNK